MPLFVFAMGALALGSVASCSLLSLDDLQHGATSTASSTDSATSSSSGSATTGTSMGTGGGCPAATSTSFCAMMSPLTDGATTCNDFDDEMLDGSAVLGDVTLTCEESSSAPYALRAHTTKSGDVALFGRLFDGSATTYARLSFDFRIDQSVANAAIASLRFSDAQAKVVSNAYIQTTPNALVLVFEPTALDGPQQYALELYKKWRRLDLEVFRSDAYRARLCLDGKKVAQLYMGATLELTSQGGGLVGLATGANEDDAVLFDNVVVSTEKVPLQNGTCPIGECGCDTPP